jgi:hypothetical protein
MGNKHSVGTLLLLILVIALSLTACTGSQEALADAPASPTLVPSATPVELPSATPDVTPTQDVPTATPTESAQYFPDINNIGSEYTVEVSESAELGEEKTYSHYPSNTVQYDALFVDDELLAVEYICIDETRDLMGWFSLAEEAVDGVVPYKSWAMDFYRRGCRIDFTVKNTEGDTIGLRFDAHCPTCHY